jgi:hypothetical protein
VHASETTTSAPCTVPLALPLVTEHVCHGTIGCALTAKA